MKKPLQISSLYFLTQRIYFIFLFFVCRRAQLYISEKWGGENSLQNESFCAKKLTTFLLGKFLTPIVLCWLELKMILATIKQF